MPTVSGNVGAVGPFAGTYLPVADAIGVTVDTTTYSDTIKGSGKLTTLVFPADAGAFAIALSGDAFPRYVLAADSTNYGLVIGDGTVDPASYPGLLSASAPNNGNGRTNLAGGIVNITAGQNLGNAGFGTQLNSPIQLATSHTSFGARLSSGAGAPGLGGGVGDIYIRTDGGALTTVYRCTVAGTAGNATWTGIV